MLKTLIVLPDGTEIFSGGGDISVETATIKQQVNSAKPLTLGSTCSAMLDVKFKARGGALSLSEGDEVAAYKVTEAGTRHLMGMFILQKPTRPSANTMRITAYDRITRLDKDLTDWFANLEGWPYRLFDLAEMVCEACGLTLANDSIPNGDYYVQAFSAFGITGRKLMQWIGEAAGRFCRATPSGFIELAWYEPSGVSLTPNGDRFYYLNGLSYEDYSVMPVEKVQIKHSTNDVGVIWPNETGEKNTYIISGNYLLTTKSADLLTPVVQTLYNQLKNASYTPCKVQLPACLDIQAGQTVNITDRNGKSFVAYVMTKTQTGQRDTLECTGAYKRTSGMTLVNNQTFEALSGRVLEMQQSVDGFSVTAKNIQENAIYSTVEEFYLSDSPTALSGGSWSEKQPVWTQGKYIWRRSKVTKGDGTVSYTPSEAGVCITGNTGAAGKDGTDGIAGKDGADGVSTYFYVKYSVNANGNPMTDTPSSTTKYMGVCSTTAPAAPTSYSAYKWTQCRGNDGTNGTPGAAGADGKTQYLHIKYSDDGETFTANNGEDLGAWIGTLVDFNEADSADFGAYTWKKFTEDVDEELESLQGEITSIRAATSNLSVRDDSIAASVNILEQLLDSTNQEVRRTQEQIASVNLQSNQLEVRIEEVINDGAKKVSNTTGTFDQDGLTIDKSNSTTKTRITADGMEVFAKGYGGDTVVLTANSNGVEAKDLNASTYLSVGGRSRFENYGSDRTGCFWIG